MDKSEIMKGEDTDRYCPVTIFGGRLGRGGGSNIPKFSKGISSKVQMPLK